jgi:hypothetical protein
MGVVAATPARPKPTPAGGGPERSDFNLGPNGEYRFDYATGEVSPSAVCISDLRFEPESNLKSRCAFPCREI